MWPAEQNSTNLCNSIFEINAIEIHWIKDKKHDDNFKNILITSVKNEWKLECIYYTNQYACPYLLFHCFAIKHYVTDATYELEQPAFLLKVQVDTG